MVMSNIQETASVTEESESVEASTGSPPKSESGSVSGVCLDPSLPEPNSGTGSIPKSSSGLTSGGSTTQTEAHAEGGAEAHNAAEARAPAQPSGDAHSPRLTPKAGKDDGIGANDSRQITTEYAQKTKFKEQNIYKN